MENSSAQGWVRAHPGIATLVAIWVTALVAVYFVVGWQRMEAACVADAAVPRGASPDQVEYSWSWFPPGFTCEWVSDNGSTPEMRRSLWWG